MRVRHGFSNYCFCRVSANCTAGQYLDVDENMCRSCERGTYQSKEWQTSCDDCPPGNNNNNNNNNNNFLCANILENQAQWCDKTKGLSNCVNVEQCVSR